MVTDLALKNNIDFEIELPKSTVKWTSVCLSEVITKGKRLEATFFDVQLKRVLKHIVNHKYPLQYICGENGLSTCHRPGIIKRVFIEDVTKGIPMLTPSQISEINPKAEKYLAPKMRENISDWFVKGGQILLTCSGTVGKLSIVTATLEGNCVSQNLIRITPHKEVDIGYLYCYLSSNSGQILLTTNNYGAVIQHIDPGHLEKIPIPDAPTSFKTKISNLIMKSFALRDEANKLISSATELLIKELELPSIYKIQKAHISDTKSVETFNVKLSKLNGRIDASYHVPLVELITNHLEKNAAEITTIGDKRISENIILPGRFKRVYVEENHGVTFFSGKNILELDPSDKKYLSFAKHDRRIKDELTIREGMILVTCSGTIGRVAYVPSHWDGWAMTHDIIRLLPNPSIKGYVYAWLKTPYAEKMLQAYSYGSVVSHIEKIHLGNMIIPLLKDAEIQRQVNDMAITASSKLTEAFHLEQKAKDLMDDFIFSS